MYRLFLIGVDRVNESYMHEPSYLQHELVEAPKPIILPVKSDVDKLHTSIHVDTIKLDESEYDVVESNHNELLLLNESELERSNIVEHCDVETTIKKTEMEDESDLLAIILSNQEEIKYVQFNHITLSLGDIRS